MIAALCVLAAYVGRI